MQRQVVISTRDLKHLIECAEMNAKVNEQQSKLMSQYVPVHMCNVFDSKRRDCERLAKTLQEAMDNPDQITQF